MTVGEVVPSGNEPQASGVVPDTVVEGGKVAYESHLKLLGEKKKVAERAAALELELESLRAKERERENQELEKSKNYEQLLKNREEELKALKDRTAKFENERVQARKLDAFIKTLGGSLEDKYWSLVDLDKIAVDPATNTVDTMSVSRYVDEYRATYPETIKRPAGYTMSSNAPDGSGRKLTIEEWKALPLKDKKARMHEVIPK
jgi:hypothetical protein